RSQGRTPLTEGALMATATRNTSRTERLLALMAKGDDLFNTRDWEALEPLHHPDMIAHIPGSAEPIYGREATGAAMKQLVRMFPDIRVHTPTRSSSETATGSPSSPTPPERSRGR